MTEPVGGANRFNVGDKKKYVRIRNIIRDQFVEFDFAIDDPRLYVELILPKAAFKEFCAVNDVLEMTAEQCQLVDDDAQKWRYGTETLASKNRASSQQESDAETLHRRDSVRPLTNQ